jgi:hypothetical protein
MTDRVVPFKPKERLVATVNDNGEVTRLEPLSVVPMPPLRWNGSVLEYVHTQDTNGDFPVKLDWRPVPIKAQDEPEESPNSPIA